MEFPVITVKERKEQFENISETLHRIISEIKEEVLDPLNYALPKDYEGIVIPGSGENKKMVCHRMKYNSILTAEAALTELKQLQRWFNG